MQPLVAIWLCAFPSCPQLAPASTPTAAEASFDRTDWFAEVADDLSRSEYRFSADADNACAWSAPNRAQDLRSRVSASGIELTPRTDTAGDAQMMWKVALATKSFGRTDHARPTIAASARAEAERIELDHGEFVEWFVNDERGIEHGWTIATRPAGDGLVSIQLAILGDLGFRIDESRRSAALVDSRGATRLRYSGLSAFDSAGRELEARLAPRVHGVAIEIDDSGARYPVTVDPILTGPAWTAESDQTGASFGWSVAPAGDVNGDGFSDVIVGAYLYDNGQSNEGRAFVYLGSPSGLSTTAAWTSESNQAGANYGASVAMAGDVNGDGYSDVVVGARTFDSGQVDEGRAFVYLGSSAGLAASASWTAESDQAFAQFGTSVATAGDVNGDGYSDVIVGADQHDNGQSNEGRAYVYLGSATGLASTAAWTAESDQADARLGASVATAGDVDGDGYDDVIVGALDYDNGQTDEGRASVYRGSSSGLAATPVWVLESNQANAQLGISVATAGDVNGDGFSDVIIGAHAYDDGQTDEGRAFVYLGTVSGPSGVATWSAESDLASAHFGISVATAGDVNGDGYSDVIVGAYLYDNGESDEGRAFVYLGEHAGLADTTAWTAESNQAAAFFGFSVATAGDVNGDGFSDVIAGSSSYDNGQANEGRAFVYLGSSAGLLTFSETTVESDQAGALFATSVATAGDVNGDGYSDVIAGAFLYDNGQTDEGRAYLYLGSATGLSTTPAWTAESDQADAKFGFSVATAGDVNGDGYDDVVVGAPEYDGDQMNEGRVFLYVGSSTGLATSPAWTAESNQVNSDYAWSVASAGDVNGDGYGDVIVGVLLYTNGEVNEGGAFLYMGSPTGLSTSAAWTAESDQIGAFMGRTVATAGDVNGDGYSDVIVSAHSFVVGTQDMGAAFVYLGSAAGLSSSASWMVTGTQNGEEFGSSVASAGDVNGDGFSDVAVGATDYHNGQTHEGGAFVYLGSSTGLSTSAAWTAESDQSDSLFGSTVASAGDVNGDGYGDVIVGAHRYDNGQTDEGRAFVYLGSSSGLAAMAAWIEEIDQAGAAFGFSIATAGDVDGDGRSDVIVGAQTCDNGQSDEGRAFVYFGNEERGGWTRAPQQRRSNDAAPIALLGRSRDDREFRIRLDLAHELAGFEWASGRSTSAQLEWEIAPLSAPLDGSRNRRGEPETVAALPLTFDELVEFHPVAHAVFPPGVARRAASGAYHWRARVRTNNPLFPVTPWTTIPWNGVTVSKLRVAPLTPITPIAR